MSAIRRIRRSLVALLLICTAVTAAGLIAIQAQQWYLRYRAERLLTDIRALQMRRSTFEEAQRLYAKWRKGAHYTEDCSSANCHFVVEFADFSYRHGEFFSHHPRLFGLYQVVGGHSARIIANVSVRDGFVWAKNFAIFVEAPPDNVLRENSTYTLIASAETVPRFLSFGHVKPDLLAHPEYEVGRPGG